MKEAALDVLGHYNLLERPLVQMQLYQAGALYHIVEIINTDMDETTPDTINRIATEVLVVVITLCTLYTSLS